MDRLPRGQQCHQNGSASKFSTLYHSNLDHSSTDRERCFTCPSLGQRKAGPLISSASQAALFTEMSGCTTAKDDGQGNNVHHMQQVHISDRKVETHMDIYIQHESNHHPELEYFHIHIPGISEETRHLLQVVINSQRLLFRTG